MTSLPGHEDDIVQEGRLLRAVDSTSDLKSGSDNGSGVGRGVVAAAAAGEGGRRAKEDQQDPYAGLPSYFRDKH